MAYSPAPPAQVWQRLGDPPPLFESIPSSWLPFEWPIQAMPGEGIYARAEASEMDWARALLQLRLPHPPVPLVRQRIPETRDPELLTFCWSLNQVVQGPRLDQDLQALGYDPADSKTATVTHLVELAPLIPEFARVMLLLELLYREIPLSQQNELKAACGEDQMRAAYQMNMMCIDPQDQDRTLLQVQRIAFKLCGPSEAVIRSGIETLLSDGRIV